MTYHHVIWILSSVPDVRNVFPFYNGSLYHRKIVPLIEADVLRVIELWTWSSDYNVVKSFFQCLYVMHVCSAYSCGERCASLIGKNVSFDA